MRNIQNAPKRAISLSLNTKVLDMARDLGLNISQTVEASADAGGAATAPGAVEHGQRRGHRRVSANAAEAAGRRPRAERLAVEDALDFLFAGL